MRPSFAARLRSVVSRNTSPTTSLPSSVTSLNATGTTFGTPAQQVARSHMFSLSSFLTFSVSMIRFSLWFLSLPLG